MTTQSKIVNPLDGPSGQAKSQILSLFDFVDHLQATGYRVNPTAPVQWLPHPTKAGQWVVALGIMPAALRQAQDRCISEPSPQPRPKPTFRAANEPVWARLLDALGITWRYEALEPDLSRAIRYQPDFWLPEQRAWLEIKRELPTPGEWRVARQLHQATGADVYLVSGWPATRSFLVAGVRQAGEFQIGSDTARVRAQQDFMSQVTLCQLFDCGLETLGEGLKKIRMQDKR